MLKLERHLGSLQLVKIWVYNNCSLIIIIAFLFTFCVEYSMRISKYSNDFSTYNNVYAFCNFIIVLYLTFF